MRLHAILLIVIALGRVDGQTIAFEPARWFGLDAANDNGRRFVQFLPGDWNADGKTDLAALSPPDAILFFAGDGCGNFQLAGEMALTAPNTIAAADLNSDGRTDLVIGSTWTDPLGSNELHILLSEGDFRFREVGRLSSQARPWIGVTVADVNRDGKSDLLVFPNGLYVSVLLGNDDGTFADPISTSVFFSMFVAMADFNTDGIPDLMDHDFSYKPRILFGGGNGTFQEPVIVNALDAWCGVKVLEANGDGIPDLLTCTGVFRGNGRGEFEPLTNTSLWADYREPGIADFNRDGISDLLFFPEVYSGDGRGGFVLSTTIPFTDGTWLAPLIVDVNNDDKLDLVIANGTHRFAVFLNRSGL